MKTPPSGSAFSDQIQKLSELIHGIRIAMFTTIDEQGSLHSRPMATQAFDFDGDLWFFTHDRTPKSHEIQKDQHVNVSYSKPDDHRFVSVAGRAELVHDKNKMKELWSPVYRAWFPEGLNDPNICLIRVHVEHAQYWDTKSSTMVHLIGLAKALTTGRPYQPGKNEKIDLTG